TRIKTKAGNTSNMARHLKLHPSKHKEFSAAVEEIANVEKKKKTDSDCVPTSSAAKSCNQSNNLDNYYQKFPSCHIRAVAITNKIGRMIARDLQPYCIVDDPGFSELIGYLEPRYAI